MKKNLKKLIGIVFLLFVTINASVMAKTKEEEPKTGFMNNVKELKEDRKSVV